MPNCFVRLRSLSIRAIPRCSIHHSSTMVVGGINKTAYNKLCDRAREINRIKGVMGLLEWDEQTFMPEGSMDARGNQKAALAGCIHEKETAKELGDIIKQVQEQGMEGLDQWEKAVVRDMKREYEMSVRVKKELKEKMSKLETEGQHIWAKARKDNCFEDFAPILEKLLSVQKEYAVATRPALDPYDACIDMFERGMTAKRFDEIFGELKKPLKELLNKITSSTSPKVPSIFDGGDVWDVDGQEKACKEVSKMLGFDFKTGRCDKSTHPFTGGSHPTDVRITTRYSKEVPFEGIMGTVHEVRNSELNVLLSFLLPFVGIAKDSNLQSLSY